MTTARASKSKTVHHTPKNIRTNNLLVCSALGTKSKPSVSNRDAHDPQTFPLFSAPHSKQLAVNIQYYYYYVRRSWQAGNDSKIYGTYS